MAEVTVNITANSRIMRSLIVTAFRHAHQEGIIEVLLPGGIEELEKALEMIRFRYTQMAHSGVLYGVRTFSPASQALGDRPLMPCQHLWKTMKCGSIHRMACGILLVHDAAMKPLTSCPFPSQVTRLNVASVAI